MKRIIAKYSMQRLQVVWTFKHTNELRSLLLFYKNLFCKKRVVLSIEKVLPCSGPQTRRMNSLFSQTCLKACSKVSKCVGMCWLVTINWSNVFMLTVAVTFENSSVRIAQCYVQLVMWDAWCVVWCHQSIFRSLTYFVLGRIGSLNLKTWTWPFRTNSSSLN